MIIVPKAEDVLQEGDLMVMLGDDRHIDHIREIGKTPPKKVR